MAEEDEKNVTELLAPLSISQPAVSKRLRILREAGLVRSREEGRLKLYGIEAGRLRRVHDWVSHFERYWDEKLDALGECLDSNRQNRSTD